MDLIPVWRGRGGNGRAPGTHSQSSEMPSLWPRQDPMGEEDVASSHQLFWTLLMDLVTWLFIL